MTYPDLPTYRPGIPRTYSDLSLWSEMGPRDIWRANYPETKVRKI
jgi:hypothetical protein